MVSILLSSPRCYPQRSIPLCDKQIFKLVSETPSWKLYDQCTAKGKIDISLLDAINTKYQGGHNLASRAMKVAIETNQLDVLKYFVDHPLGDTSHLEQAANTGNSDLLNLVWDSLEKYCRVKGVGLESAWLLPAFTKAVEENNWNGFSGLLSRVHLFEWSKISTGNLCHLFSHLQWGGQIMGGHIWFEYFFFGGLAEKKNESLLLGGRGGGKISLGIVDTTIT
eukprot:TRINITY_DN5444_c0_g1_i12.p2 TRINITY_DN5444_c0_g1~~TRINITY_DN5444_c0_g1_i12.p2  ORF type:complete len:223 (-),score=41.10 TRINITY_DN5444_c0_g1_i12:932-1600(-)